MSSATQSKKNVGTIELMRFIFSVVVITLHGNYFGWIQCRLGAVAVEFFFIVSGFLMMKKIDSLPEPEAKTLGTETWKYIFEKIKRLIPYLLFAYVVMLSVKLYFADLNLKHTIICVLKSLSDLLLIRMSGIDLQIINPQLWYISAMLLAMMIYYPIARKNKNLFMNVVAPLCFLFILGWTYKSGYASVSAYAKWGIIAYSGMIRAMAAIPLGCACYAIAKWLSSFELRKWVRIVLTLAELTSYSITVLICFIYDKRAGAIALIFLMAFGVVLSFSRQTYLGAVFDNGLFYWLGKISLPLYSCQMFVRFTITTSGIDLSPKRLYLLYIVGTVVSAIVCELFAAAWRHIDFKKLSLFTVKKQNVIPTDKE